MLFLLRGFAQIAANNGPRAVAIVAALVAGLTAVPSRGAGQTPMKGDSVHAAQTLFTWRDGVLAATFAATTVAMFPVDQSAARHLQDSTTQASRFLRNVSHDVQYIADPGSIIIGVSMYGIGRVAGWHDVADLGLHGIEAVVLSGGATALIKGLAGRARPYVSLDTNAADFRFGRGFNRGGYQSFPSGHTSAAFAAASVVTSEAQRWWPHHTWLVAPAMYGGATLVGVSRMYNNAHWASDVVLGAAIGTFSGIKVVRYSHGHTNNFVDRALLGLHVVPMPDGLALVVER
jgi:membrane-associated phospholipid phosphatase